MGMLHPLCLATNSQTIHILAIVRYVDQGNFDTNPDFLVLASAQSEPLNLDNLTWSIISITPRTQLPQFPQQQPTPDWGLEAKCVVDEEGLFTFSVSGNPGEVQSAMFDPSAKRVAQSKTVVLQGKDVNVGEWVPFPSLGGQGKRSVDEFWLFDMKSSEGKDAKSQAMISTYSAYEGHTRTPPSVEIHPAGPLNIIPSSKFDNRTHILKCCGPTEIHSFAYGGGNLYTLLQTIPPDGLVDQTWTMNRTLRVFPFSSSQGMALTPTLDIPWNLPCADELGSMSLSAYGGGRYYYLCKSRLGTGVAPVRVYQLEGDTARPIIFSTSGATFLASSFFNHFSLLSRPTPNNSTNNNSGSEPLYALIRERNGRVYWVNLPRSDSTSGRGVSEGWKPLPYIMVQVQIRSPTIEAPRNGGDDECGESCHFSKTLTNFVIGMVLAGVGLFFIVVYLVWRWRKGLAQSRERRLQAERDGQELAAVAGRHHDVDADSLKDDPPPPYPHATGAN